MSVQASRAPRTVGVDVPGGHLLHPVVLAAIVVFVINDHLLKPAHAGWLTGKLSDVAGLIFFPVLLAAIAELVSPAARRHGAAVLFLAVAVTGLTYVVMLVVPAGADGYRWLIGVLQWPFRIGAALAAGTPVPAIAPVRFVADATDLITLPALLVPLVLAIRAADPKRRAASRIGD
jgi:hypothetical protein